MRFPASPAAAVLALAPWAVAGAAQRPLGGGSSSGPAAARAPAPASAPTYRDELLGLHRSLVSIESITGNEAAVGRFLDGYLAARGYEVERQRVGAEGEGDEGGGGGGGGRGGGGRGGGGAGGGGRFNVLARPSGRGGIDGSLDNNSLNNNGRRPPPRLVVTSHIDVVPPHIPYAIDTDASGAVGADTVIRGRGSVDAKASVAAMVVALGELLAAGAVEPDDAMLLFVVGEEVAGDGMRAFSRSLDGGGGDDSRRPRAVVFGEPTDNRLACGHKGMLSCAVAARGTPGHSGYPWLGRSANALLVRAMAGLLDADLGSSPRFGNTTVNVGRLDGGVAANVIAEHAVAELAVRVAAGSEADGAEAVRHAIRAVLDAVDGEALSLECGQGYGPVKCDCDVPGFETVVVNYGTDIGNLKGEYAKYLYGPGSILVAHGPHENLTVGDLETAVEGYRRLILHALKQ